MALILFSVGGDTDLSPCFCTACVLKIFRQASVFRAGLWLYHGRPRYVHNILSC